MPKAFMNPDESALQDWRDLENIKEVLTLFLRCRLVTYIIIIVDSMLMGSLLLLLLDNIYLVISQVLRLIIISTMGKRTVLRNIGRIFKI